MKGGRTIALILGAALVGTGTARAQGFLQWDQSARVLGMGGAASGLSDQPTAVFFSPAAIVHLAGTQLHAGGVLAAREGSFDGYDAPDTDADLRVAATPTVYATHAIAEGLTGGLGVSTPWRVDLAWNDPESFVGRFRATDFQLRGVAVNPVVAYEVTPGWAVAAGISIIDAGLELHRFEQDPALSALGGAGPIALARGEYDLDGNGAGWNVAGFWRPSDGLAAGLQMRGRIEVDVSGAVDYTVVAPQPLRQVVIPGEGTVGERIDARYADQTVRSRLELPATVIAGLAWAPIQPLMLAADLQWVGWSTFDEFSLVVADTVLVDRTPLDYDDSWAIRLGAEANPSGHLRVRVGYAHEWSRSSLGAVTPLFPDADRNAISFGAGFQWMETELDLGYRLTVLEDREGVAFPANTTAADGRFESIEHSFAMGATLRF